MKHRNTKEYLRNLNHDGKCNCKYCRKFNADAQKVLERELKRLDTEVK